MTLDDLSWQLDSGVVLNPNDIVMPFVDITRVIGFDSAPYRETIRDHEGTDGGFIDAEFERGRDIALEGIVYGDVETIETYLDDLKENYAPRQSPVALVYKMPGVDERTIFVKPRGARYDVDTARRIGSTPIQFMLYAEDPRQYTNVLNSTAIAFGGLATTGFGFNFGFNLSFGAVVPVGGTYVTVGGNRPTPPTFTISGPVTNPRIINITDSKSLDFTISLGALDSMVVDTATRSVVVNGYENRRDALTTLDWFFLNPGDTFIQFGGGTGSGSLTVSYRNAWR